MRLRMADVAAKAGVSASTVCRALKSDPQIPEATREAHLRNVPVGRLGTAADVAEVVAFLSSDAAAYITGQVIGVDGGLV